MPGLRSSSFAIILAGPWLPPTSIAAMSLHTAISPSRLDRGTGEFRLISDIFTSSASGRSLAPPGLMSSGYLRPERGELGRMMAIRL